MRSLRFIHSADLHLDSPFKGKSYLPDELKEQLRASTFEAYERLINQAIHHQVDFVLIVGDLFNEEMRSLKAQVKLREGFQRLEHYGIQVYVSYGNHDYIRGVHYPISYPSNVHIFKDEEVRSLPFYRDDRLIANIYGFSYEQRSVTENKAQLYNKQGEADYHIAMLHGSLETAQASHDVYAPFTMADLVRKSMDYWALGHIHKRQQLSDLPPVIYPGNIQGRSSKENEAKGCYLVEWKGDQFVPYFLPLHSFIYENVEQICKNLKHPEDLEALLEEAKQSIICDSPILLTITLKGDQGLLEKWKYEGVLKQWVEIVNERENIDQEWIWIDQVFIEDQPSWNESELKASAHFTGEVLRNFDNLSNDDIQDYMAPLYKHRRASKHLNDFSDTEQQEIMESAKSLVIQQLLKGKEVDS
ncbi:metallophosphoesterase family protein [Halobacillus seohaensis]|uniref:Exonuclease SbcCD subunit D n=1 Tax=Halobacillus seohaensis TaxID=447421 RepID=A0ABW2ENH6_9BACI